MSGLGLTAKERRALWERTFAEIEAYLEKVPELPVAPELDPEALRGALAELDFERSMTPRQAIALAVDGLTRHQVHTPHPRYFGLFNPAPTAMGIAADALVAAFNPQLAAWSHSPWAAEVERHLVRAFAGRFGYRPEKVEGCFASGGAEANHTAVVAALTRNFPEFPRHGVRALRSQPVAYVSAEGHHSVRKAARLTGLGSDAVSEIGADAALRLDPELVRAQIRADRDHGFAPFLVVATAGTTAAGVIDPLIELSEMTQDEDVWLHVDAAWGGAAALVPELAEHVAGIERADSVTFDAHKLLSVPMGAGVFWTRHRGVMERAFRVAAGYMPREARDLDVADPWAHTMQWSRRFIGLKVLLSLAVAGWDGYAEAIRHQVAMGEMLREALAEDGWRVVNETPLPLVCFVDGTRPDGAEEPYLEAVAGSLRTSGKAWISTVRLGTLGPALRACITHYGTGEDDVRVLTEGLAAARAAI